MIKSSKDTRYAVDAVVTYDGTKFPCWPLPDLLSFKHKIGAEAYRELERAKKKKAAFIVTFEKREQEIAELKSTVRDLRAQLKPPSMQMRRLLLDPAIHDESTRLKEVVNLKQ